MPDKWPENGKVVTLYSCCQNEAARQAISSFMDGEADRMERVQAEQHLEACPDCRRLVASWSRSRASLLQAAHNSQLERIAEAVAGQTRAWLQTEILTLPNRPVLASHRQQPRRLLGAVATFVTLVLVSMSVFYTALLTGPDLKPAPVATARTSVQPVTLLNVALSPSPSEASAGLPFAYRHPLLIEPAPERFSTSPALASYSLRYYSTPGVGGVPSPRN